MNVSLGYQIISECDGTTTVAFFANNSLCLIAAGSTNDVRLRLKGWRRC